MAQRRSKNRRLSRRSSNISGFLDDNTNIIDNSDPQWCNRSILRPSTSFISTKNASSVLNPDSSDETQSTNNWYNNLSRSESSKLMEDIVRSKVNDQNNVHKDNKFVEPVTESESETEFQRKRTNLRVNNKTINKSDKSNVFLKALETTRESHTRNSTVQIPESYESEAASDDSRTMKRTKPTLFKNNKVVKENKNIFDDLFHNDSTIENVQTSISNTRSSLKRNSKEIEHRSILRASQKFGKTIPEKRVELDSMVNETNFNTSVNKSNNKTVLGTPIQELRNRSSVRKSVMISKNGNDNNLFDEIFNDNSNQEHILAIEQSSAKIQKQKTDEDISNSEHDESDTSSIPKYIRRTRSVVPKRVSTELKDISDSWTGKQRDLRKMNHDRSEVDRASDRGQGYNTSHQLYRNDQNTDESEDLSINQSLDKSNKFANTSSQKSIRATKDADEEHADNKHGETITPDVTNKTRSRLLRNNNARISDDENIFVNILDNEISVPLEKSEILSIDEPRLMRTSQSKKLSQNLNNETTSFKSVRKSMLNESQSISQMNLSLANESNPNNSQQTESEDETSTIPNHIRRTRSRLFQKSNVANTSSSAKSINAKNTSIDKSSKSNRSQLRKSVNFESKVQNSKQSFNKSTSELLNSKRPNSHIFKKLQESQQKVDTSKTFKSSTNSLKENQGASKSKKSKTKKSNISLNQTNVESNSRKDLSSVANKIKKRTSLKSKRINVNLEENDANDGISSQQNLFETIRDGTSKSKTNTTNRVIPHNFEKSVNEDYLSDDLLRTPNPAHSTLKVTGKPLTRISQFFLKNGVLNETKSSQSPLSSNDESIPPPARNNLSNTRHPSSLFENNHNSNEEEEVEIDVVNDSNYNEATRHFIDQPDELEQSTSEEEMASFLNTKTSKINPISTDDNAVTIDESVWAEVKKKTDALKIIMENQRKRQETIEHERERERARIQAKLKRAMAQHKADLKKQQKKPIDKAYFVDGKLYKQPKLPVPKNWVTQRLYKYLWKHMEPKFGIKTRIKSEKFVMKLSDVFTVVTRRKKYENYKEDIDDLMIRMAKLGIIETRYDFYEFSREFMPYSFRIKVIPMMLPGNKRNIPYDRDLVFKPIL